MSVMKTTPVFFCRRCRRPVRVTLLATEQPDDNGALLHDFMRNLDKIAYCGSCKRAYNYYASVGRSEAFLRGDV